MKNTIKFLGIIAIVAIIGFSFAACQEEEPEPKDELDGTFWDTTLNSGGIMTLKFESHNYYLGLNNESWNLVGTYTISENTITLNNKTSGQAEAITLSEDRNTFVSLGRTYIKRTE
jgi:hypothetical protein